MDKRRKKERRRRREQKVKSRLRAAQLSQVRDGRYVGLQRWWGREGWGSYMRTAAPV